MMESLGVDTAGLAESADSGRAQGQTVHGWERNRHLINRGDGTFKEVGRGTNTDLILNSRGIAVADFWNRGVLDIAVSASTARHALLKNEVGQARDYLAVELVGAVGDLADGTNRDAVGARVYIRHAGQQQMREIVLGDGYGSQNGLRAHFGLGGERGETAPEVEEVRVVWPRGNRTQTFQNVTANRIIEITEGSDEIVEKTYAPPVVAADEEASEDA